MTNHSVTDVPNINQFRDLGQTNEYKFAICDLGAGGQDKYMFHDGISFNQDIDDLFDTFERLSVVYISRNFQKVIIRDNNFDENIGTFGGAITVNSPNWQQGQE